jgi:hypothetical protein
VAANIRITYVRNGVMWQHAGERRAKRRRVDRM